MQQNMKVQFKIPGKTPTVILANIFAIPKVGEYLSFNLTPSITRRLKVERITHYFNPIARSTEYDQVSVVIECSFHFDDD